MPDHSTSSLVEARLRFIASCSDDDLRKVVWARRHVSDLSALAALHEANTLFQEHQARHHTSVELALEVALQGIKQRERMPWLIRLPIRELLIAATCRDLSFPWGATAILEEAWTEAPGFIWSRGLTREQEQKALDQKFD